MFEPGWILTGFIEDRLVDPKQFNQVRLRPIPIFCGTPNFLIIIAQTKEISPSQTSMAATNMFEPGWFLIGFIDDRLGDTQTFQSSPAQTYSHFLWNAKLPYFLCSNNKFFSNSNSHGGYKYVWAELNPVWFHWGSSRGHKTSQTGPAQTNSHFLWDAKLPYNHCSNTKFFFNSNFHGGYKYVWAGLNPDRFHWESSRGHKTIQSSPAQTHSHLIWDAKFPSILQSDNKFFSISNFHGGYIYVWAGLNPDWFHWGSSRRPKTIQSSPAQTHSYFLWDAKLPHYHCSNTKFFFNSNFHGGYKYVWAALNPDKFHWRSSKRHKTIQSNPAQTHSHLIWDAKFSYIFQSDNKFFSISNFHGGYKYVWAELIPDWFHWWSSRGHKTIQSSPAQTYSHFLWNAKLPYFLCSNNKFFSNSNFHGGYKYVWAGLNPDWFHWESSKGSKKNQSGPAQTNSHFLWDAKLPYNHCSNTKFFFNSNFHGGYKYVWAGLNPDWFHWWSSRGHKTIQSSPAQTHSYLIWDAKFPIIIVRTKEISPSQISLAATNMFEPGWFLISVIDDRLGDTKQFNPARLKPIPI